MSGNWRLVPVPAVEKAVAGSKSREGRLCPHSSPHTHNPSPRTLPAFGPGWGPEGDGDRRPWSGAPFVSELMVEVRWCACRRGARGRGRWRRKGQLWMDCVGGTGCVLEFPSILLLGWGAGRLVGSGEDRVPAGPRPPSKQRDCQELSTARVAMGSQAVHKATGEPRNLGLHTHLPDLGKGDVCSGDLQFSSEEASPLSRLERALPNGRRGVWGCQ